MRAPAFVVLVVLSCLVPGVALAQSSQTQEPGSPLDNLPPHIQVLPIELPEGKAPMRADWSPDGRRLVFLDGPIGDVWRYDLASGEQKRLTGARGFLPGGVLRAHHLSNGDLVLCAPPVRSADDPEGDRFRGELFVLPRPLGTRPPVALGERCWEGIAVSKQPGSTRIAWNRSNIDFGDVPAVFVQALLGESKILTGRIVYDATGRPALADKRVAVNRYDVGLDAVIEAQDFRRLNDGDADGDDELLFTAYFHKGGQVMGRDLDTGRVVDYSRAPWYEEAEGIDPAGQYILVEREIALVLFPGELDVWRLTLDGSGAFERLTTFTEYDSYGATNPVVAPDGSRFAFQLEKEGTELGEGHGLLLFDFAKWDA